MNAPPLPAAGTPARQTKWACLGCAQVYEGEKPPAFSFQHQHSWVAEPTPPSTGRPDETFTEIADRIVRNHETFCKGHSEPDAPYCSTLLPSDPMCDSCSRLRLHIAQAIRRAVIEDRRGPVSGEGTGTLTPYYVQSDGRLVSTNYDIPNERTRKVYLAADVDAALVANRIEAGRVQIIEDTNAELQQEIAGLRTELLAKDAQLAELLAERDTFDKGYDSRLQFARLALMKAESTLADLRRQGEPVDEEEARFLEQMRQLHRRSKGKLPCIVWQNATEAEWMVKDDNPRNLWGIRFERRPLPDPPAQS